MKKILSIASVAILTASTLFAGVTGNAKVAFGYDTTSKEYGFKNSTGFEVDLDLATFNYPEAKAEDAEAAETPDVYAGIKASMNVKLADKKAGNATIKKNGLDQNTSEGTDIWTDKSAIGLGVFFDVAEAYVAGKDWKVSILETQGAPDYAKSAIETKTDYVKDIFGNPYDKKYVPVTYKVSSKKAAGLTVTVKDWTVSAGLAGVKDDNKALNYNAYIQTPGFAFADEQVKLQVAAIASGSEKTNKTKTEYNESTKKYETAITTKGNEAYDAMGASAKIAFENDAFKVSTASDFGMKKERVDNKKWKIGMDAAANFTISPVAVDIYFKNEDLSGSDFGKNTLLSAKTVVDLNAFEVPVALTVTGKDLVNSQDLSLKAAFNITEALSADATVGYVIDTKKLSTSANIAYTVDAFTAKAGVAYSTIVKAKDSNVLSATASVESSALIPGATLALTYGKDSADNDMNFLKGQSQAGKAKPQNFGAITASCKIAF